MNPYACDSASVDDFDGPVSCGHCSRSIKDVVWEVLDDADLFLEDTYCSKQCANGALKSFLIEDAPSAPDQYLDAMMEAQLSGEAWM